MILALAPPVGRVEAQPQVPPAVDVRVDARSLQPGELVVLTITTREPAERVRARAFSRVIPAYRVDEKTWKAVIGLDLGVDPGRHDVSIEAIRGGKTERATYPLDVTSKTFRTRTLTVDSAFVDPPARVQARIKEEAAEMARLWVDSAAERLWAASFVRPVPHDANSAFGSRSVFNGQARSSHSGADFASPAGTPVRSPNGGRVVLARDLYYTGGTVVIDHGLGLVSLFAHLSSIDATVGQRVEAGQVVGKVGATGRVTGAHLHWTLRAGGARVDPLSLLAVLGAR